MAEWSEAAPANARRLPLLYLVMTSEEVPTDLGLGMFFGFLHH